jgi:hypothetical protein
MVAPAMKSEASEQHYQIGTGDVGQQGHHSGPKLGASGGERSSLYGRAGLVRRAAEAPVTTRPQRRCAAG